MWTGVRSTGPVSVPSRQADHDNVCMDAVAGGDDDGRSGDGLDGVAGGDDGGLSGDGVVGGV